MTYRCVHCGKFDDLGGEGWKGSWDEMKREYHWFCPEAVKEAEKAGENSEIWWHLLYWQKAGISLFRGLVRFSAQ